MEFTVTFKKQINIKNYPYALSFRYFQHKDYFYTTFIIYSGDYTQSEFNNIKELNRYLTEQEELKNTVDEFLQEIPNTLTYDEKLKSIRVDNYLDFLYIEKYIENVHFEGIYYNKLNKVEFKCEYDMPTLSIRENNLTVFDKKFDEYENIFLTHLNNVKICQLSFTKELIKTLSELNIKKGWL